MADHTTKPIEDVEVGDQVIATDPETGESGPRRVTAVWPHDDYLLDLELEDGSEITTTEDHHYWNHTDQAWQGSQDLDQGDLLLTADGDTIAVEGLDPASWRRAPAYDLTVDQLHSFYVVSDSGEEILVHNQSPCTRPEAKITGSRKHGVDWTEGPATARSTDIPQGQWAVDDLDWATEQAARLDPGEGRWFDLPDGSASVVHHPDGTTTTATQAWIRNNGTGTWHGYPAP